MLEEELDEVDRLSAAHETGPPKGAVRYALDVPGALRVSSITQSGIGGLQSAVMQMLTQAPFEEALLLHGAPSDVRDVAASGLHLSDLDLREAEASQMEPLA